MSTLLPRIPASRCSSICLKKTGSIARRARTPPSITRPAYSEDIREQPDQQCEASLKPESVTWLVPLCEARGSLAAVIHRDHRDRDMGMLARARLPRL